MEDTTTSDILNRRIKHRKKVTIHGVISGRDSVEGIDCIVLDATRTGCRIVCNHVGKLPDDVCLTFDGINRPVYGEIVWRRTNQAGIEFIWSDPDEIFL
jgi:hypothetical protein